MENLSYRGVPLAYDKTYRIKLATIDAISKMERNLLFAFTVVYDEQERHYEFPLKAYLEEY